MFELTERERVIFRKLSTPLKIQDYLDTLPINYEKRGDTHRSPRRVLEEKKAHCIEGACLAAALLWYHGEDPLLLDLKAFPHDDDHVVALYRKHGYWGAISKTNHATIRFRDPIFRTIRELALSYFHEYFLNETGKKVLVSYSTPLRLAKFGSDWVTTEQDLFFLDDALDALPHTTLVPPENRRYIRRADRMERRAGRLLEWTSRNPRT